MKIISAAPLLYMTKCNGDGKYLNADGEIGVEMPGTAAGPLPGLGGAGYTPPASNASGKKQKGKLSAKAKALVGSGKVKDALSQVKGFLSGLKGGGSDSTSNTPPGPSIPDSTGSGMGKHGGGDKQGMSTGVKVAIGVVVAAVIGIIIYVVIKKKK